MALRKQGEWTYGDSQADTRAELAIYGEANEYVPTQFADAACSCGCRTFQLGHDEQVGAAVRICIQCETEHAMADSEAYLDEADLQLAICVCENDELEVTVGVALYDNSDDVRWLYIGCRCPACGVRGCYADWKSESGDYRELLQRV